MWCPSNIRIRWICLHLTSPDHLPVQGDSILHHGKDGVGCYRSVEDLADRWPTITEARNNSPADLQFRHTDRGGALITQEKTNHLAMRISQCVRQAQGSCWALGGLSQGRVGPAGLLQTTPQVAPSLDALCDRRQLLQTWTVVVQLPIPRLEDQGSDALLKKQFKLWCTRRSWLDCQQGTSYQPYQIRMSGLSRPPRR